MPLLAPFKGAVKRHAIRILMEHHSFTRAQARASYSHVSDIHYEAACKDTGVDPKSFDPSSIFQWIKDNWKTIALVALKIVGIILMFVELPPNATNIPDCRQDPTLREWYKNGCVGAPKKLPTLDEYYATQDEISVRTENES